MFSGFISPCKRPFHFAVITTVYFASTKLARQGDIILVKAKPQQLAKIQICLVTLRL